MLSAQAECVANNMRKGWSIRPQALQAAGVGAGDLAMQDAPVHEDQFQVPLFASASGEAATRAQLGADNFEEHSVESDSESFSGVGVSNLERIAEVPSPPPCPRPKPEKGRFGRTVPAGTCVALAGDGDACKSEVLQRMSKHAILKIDTFKGSEAESDFWLLVISLQSAPINLQISLTAIQGIKYIPLKVMQVRCYV